MSPRLLWASTAIAVAATLAITSAAAQALDPQAGVSAGTASLSFDPGEAQAASWTVSNAGDTQATATVTLQVPAGWTATLAPADRSFNLASGASRVIQVPVSPGGDAPANGNLVLSATMTDQVNRVSPAASAPIALTFAPAPIPPTPRDYTAEITAAIIGGTAVLLLAAGSVVYLRRATQVAILVEPKQRPITTGTDGVFLVEIENRGRRKRDVELRVDGLPATWYGAFSFPKVTLQPGERSPVPLCVKVPREAGDGMQVELTLRARPSSRFPWLVHGRTRVEAHDRVRIGPAQPVPPTQP